MRCTVKAVRFVKSYMKKDRTESTSGYQLYVQDYPMGTVTQVFSKKVTKKEKLFI